jgi:hypothetical protein
MDLPNSTSPSQADVVVFEGTAAVQWTAILYIITVILLPVSHRQMCALQACMSYDGIDCGNSS